MRLNRYLSSAGIASRRKCDELIALGKVSVNGIIVEALGTVIAEDIDSVAVEGREVKPSPERRYIVLNKPRGYISAVSDDRGRRTVIDLVGGEPGLHNVGRLDFDTTGVLLITDDGNLTHRLTHPSFGIEREYVVGLDRSFSRKGVDALKEGVSLEDGIVKPLRVSWRSGGELTLCLNEGRNRIVRRIFEKLGYEVRSLHRSRFAFLTDRGMKPGEWRVLSKEEIDKLKRTARWT